MASDKPFEATAARLARARREGDVPRSHDLGALASFACASLGIALCFPLLASAARHALLGAAARRMPNAADYELLAAGVLAIVACALAGAIVATFVQTRTFVVKFPSPKLAKLDPLQGLRRMVSRDSIVAGVKAVIVSCAVAATAFPAVRDTFVGNFRGAPEELAALALRSLMTIVSGALAVAALVAIVDIVLERSKWRRRLRMSFDEVKRDHKQSEGDAQLKGRRRNAHRSLVRGSIGRVADAAFVVANPTHVAIALEYRPPEVAVPRVLVRAIDEGALQVKRRARELRVPVIENVALARSLLATTGIGEFIAPDLYGAVAAIVAALSPAARAI